MIIEIRNPFRRRKTIPRPGLLGFGGNKEQMCYLVASTHPAPGRQPSGDSEYTAETHIRGILESAKLIEADANKANLNQMVKIRTWTVASGVTVPPDFNDYQDYLDAAEYIPKVRRAINRKQSMIWQEDFEVQGDDTVKEAVDRFLKEIDKKKTIKSGTRKALILGNMYWRVIKGKDGKQAIKPLNPLNVGVKLDSDKVTILSYVTFKPGSTTVQDTFDPKDVLHLKFNSDPCEPFGTSSLKNILPTIKAILYIEKKLPWLARRLSQPLLKIDLGDLNENTISPEEFQRLKTEIENRPEGADIYNDGSILGIEEVYKNIGNSRQMVEPVLAHFERNLIAGLGVNDVDLGVGGTTTQATAEYQERTLEPEIREYHSELKAFFEDEVFQLNDSLKTVEVIWKPLKEDDKNALSARLCQEIEHGIISPEAAARRLGYNDEDRVGIVMTGSLAPPGNGGPAQEPDEERELRIKALKKLTGDQNSGVEENTEGYSKPSLGDKNND